MVPFQDAAFPSLTPSVSPVINRGSLITFNYTFHKPGHDAWPLVLVTDVNYMTGRSPQRYLRGINLHYLTFPTIKTLLFPAPGRSVCDSLQVTYQYIKGNEYITSAFRQYKVNGIDNLKKLDCQFIVNALAISRSFDPNEIEAIRKSVREQVQRIINPQANSSAEIPFGENPTIINQ